MKNIYIGLYKIHDYIYRPTLYEDVNLYDWICLSIKFPIPKKQKSKKKNDHNVISKNEPDELDLINNSDDETVVTPVNKMKNTEYSFMSEHPQYLTHRAKMQPKTENMVPNFVPNCLPRSDSGDRENYCCTMITFFKPWRKGNDLKP